MKSYEFILEDEMLNEGALQKIASVALGIALGFSATVAKADQLFVYQHPETQKLKIAKSKERIPQDALMSFVVDTDSKTVKIIKGNQETPVQTEPAVVQKAEQTVTQKAPAPTVEPKVVEPVKEPIAKSEPKADASVVAPSTAKTDNSGYGSLSIKGIKFGASKDEVEKQIEQTGAELAPKWISGAWGNPANLPKNSWVVHKFSLGGTNYHGVLFQFDDSDKLSKITFPSIPSHEQERLVLVLQNKFGKGEVETGQVQNRIGNKFVDLKINWQLGDGASIYFSSNSSTIGNGILIFSSSKESNNLKSQSSDAAKKALGDI